MLPRNLRGHNSRAKRGIVAKLNPLGRVMDIIISIIRWLLKLITGRSGFGLSNGKLPYRKKDYLLTVAERNFYQVLSQVIEKNNGLLFAKVRLEDLLWLPRGTENRWGLRNRIKSRHIDFVICDNQSVMPLLAIELDDSSHQRQDRIERDQNIDRILHDAGLPILHIRVQHSYDSIWLEKEIKDKI